MMEPTANNNQQKANCGVDVTTQSSYAFPMSFAQQRLWFLDQFEPGNTLYNIVWPIRLRGHLNVEALQRSLDEIVARHEVLRATFRAIDDQPVQVISPWLTIPLVPKNLSGLSEDQREVEIQRLADAEAKIPISLQTGPMLRALLARLGENEHVLILTLHHIVSDRWSRGIFYRELSTFYDAFSQGKPNPFPDLPLQYTDFSVWQREWLSGKNLERQLSYWKQQLGGAPSTLELPTDRPRPASQSFHGQIYSFEISRQLIDALNALSRREGVTLFMLLLAGLQMLLARYSGQEDIVVGTPIANRNRAEIENLIGFFANTLVLRTNLSGNPTFRELLARVRDVALGAYAHQDLPFEKLVEELNPERSLSHNPLFQVLLAVQNAPKEELRLSGLTLEGIPVRSAGSKFDLALFLTEAPDGVRGRLEYNTDLFEEQTVARMMGHLEHLLVEAVANPDERISNFELLPEAERGQVLDDWNHTAAEYPNVCVHELFQKQAKKSPESVAVRFGSESLTYAELNARSNRLAHYLREQGVTAESLVGLYLDRSLEMMVALLGVLKAGAAYVPLDPAFPRERIRFIVEDSGVTTLMTQSQLRAGLPRHSARVIALDADWPKIASQSAVDACFGVNPENLAYVLYTSGSTGKPKGVEIDHRAVVNFLIAMQRKPGLTEHDILVAVTTLSFDIAGLELYLPLTCGAQVVLASPEQASDGPQLTKLMSDSGATIMQATPATWRLLIDSGWTGNSNLKVLCGGEALPRELAEQLRPLSRELWNMYGPTETTIWSSVYRVEQVDWTVAPIGHPIANTQMYVLDASRRPVPFGVAGELYIAGDGLARGYWQRPELTAEKFVENPFAPGTRFYRTGDLARLLRDGNLQYLGRMDNQLKIRGFRIELGEIESVLAQHEFVEEAVVVAREDAPGDKRLVAYVIPVKGKQITRDDLRTHLRQNLPEYMVPSGFVTLDKFPLTPNGKVDRRALPAPDRVSQEAIRLKIQPRNAVEEVVAGIWSEVLRSDNVGAHDNFFDLGGHSLLATRVISRLRQALQIELPLRAMFEAPTVAELADRIQKAQQSGKGLQAPPIVPVPREGNLALSFAQQRLWFLDQLEPNNPLYNIPWAFRLAGSLNVEALHQSLNELVRRHEVLRTTFHTEDNQPVQVIAPDLQLELPLTDLGQSLAAEAEARRLVLEDASRPFDLSRGPLLRSVLLRLAAEDHILAINVHHIVSDRWSIGVFTQELIALYGAFSEGKPSPLPELPFQYADAAAWQRQWLQGEVLEREVAYWKKQLEGAPQVLEIPTDRPRPPKESFRGDVKGIPLSPEVTEKLKTLSRHEGVTLFMTILAAWNVLLARYSGQEDIVVGIPIANRNRSEIEGHIGFFANTLTLRTDLSGNPTFRELLARTREMALGAYAHQDLPFEKLVEELRPERSLSHNPLFQVLFALQNTPSLDQEIPGLKLKAVGAKVGTAKCDLALFMAENSGALLGRLEFNTDIFDGSTIDRLISHFQTLVEAIVADPERAIGDLPLLRESERHQILDDWNATEAEYPRTRCLHQLFEAQAARTPEAPAVSFEGQSLTYRELNEQSNRLAHHLQERGIGPRDLVGVYVERSCDMTVALLAVQKAGAAYVPIDPSYPADRIRLMLEDAQPRVLLTQESLLGSIPQHASDVVCLDRDRSVWMNESAANLTNAVTPEDLVYVIFTSGSTGRPKGVQVPHRAVVNLLTSMGKTLDMGKEDVVVALASFAFDMCIPELYLPLLTGGQVVIGPRELAADGEALAALLTKVGATMIHATPTTWSLLLDAGYTGAGRKRVVGAEPLPKELWARLLDADASLYNFYGPTETTVWSTFQQFRSKDEPLTVGKPLANTQIYILSKHQYPVPIGVAGELYIGGDGVTKGYLKRPDLTAEKFVANPFTPKPDAKLYKTGDLARYLPDGSIEFLGRIDNQVKVRGYRIELGEIEAVLSSHVAVQQAIVVVREDRPGDKRLVGYVVTTTGQPVSTSELRNLVKAQLPDYMVPSSFVFLDKLPLNANGKVDRKALETSELGPAELDTYVAPRTPVEEAVAGIWAEVLRVDLIGAHDDFFALGGHSLLATQVISRIRQVFGVEMPLRAIFEGPTIGALAERIEDEKRKESGLVIPPLVPARRDRELPVSFAQQRLWILELLGGTGAAYNIPMAFRIAGALDVRVLERSITEIVSRHEALRAVFQTSDGKPVQVITPAKAVSLPITDLTDLEGDERERCALHLATEESQRPFDLKRGPLYRVGLLRLAPEDHILLATVHHIVFDGWSTGIFLNELAGAYRSYAAGQTAALPELPVQYADFAVWQRNYLQGATLDKQVSYWKEALRDAPASIDLPTDRPRPAVQTFRGASDSVVIPRPLLEQLKKLSQREGATLFMTLLAALDVMLARYSGQEDIVVGSPIAGRSRAEVEKLLGLFVNTLVFRTNVSGNPSFRELLGRVRETALGAYTYQDLPFEKLVEETRPERDLTRNPIFQVMFILHNQPVTNKEIPGLVFSPFKKDFGAAMFDLTVITSERPEGLRTIFNYNTDLFDASTVSRMLSHWQKLLQEVAANPGQPVGELRLLTEPERQSLLVEWNRTEAVHPPTCVHTLFEEQVRKTPDAVAVNFGQQSLTYSDLNRRANRLARHLAQQGVGHEALVGVYMERSLEMMVALLGVLKAGAAYVPLDPAYPKDRLTFIAQDADIQLLLTQQSSATKISVSAKVIRVDTDWPAIAAQSAEDPQIEVQPENLAYVLYTSGSTGRPKGVQIEHRNVVNFLDSMRREPGMCAEDVLLAVTTLSFDIAGLELYLPLTTGARVELASREQAADAQQLQALLKHSSATVMQATPATWRLLVESGWHGDSHLRALCGGEALPRELAEQLLPRCRELWNLYGPTETTIWSSVYRVTGTDWSLAPIGHPIANTEMYVLDKHRQPVPVGVAGELYIGGDGVARGYLNRPELTSEKFIADPFSKKSGQRLYRTGDLARYRADGSLVYLGRMDNQIKLRGFRIELGEIEAVLSQHPAVQHSVVMVREDQPGNQQLVGYIISDRKSMSVAEQERSAEQNLVVELKRSLRQKLPDYMVPSLFMMLDAFPLTPNGKANRRALPAPTFERSEKAVAPRNETEQKLVEIWQALLGIQEIGIRDNFFELGGHSLLAVRMITEIGKATDKQIPLATLFQGATIEALATALREDVLPEEKIVVEIQRGGARPPLFLIVIPGMSALGYAALARQVGEDQPVYKIQLPGPRLRGRPYTTAEYDQLADEYLRAMKTVQPEGPYYLGGMCEGARVAFDMARALEANGEEVGLLAIFDTWVIENSQIRFLWMIDYYVSRFADFWRLPLSEKGEVLANIMRNRNVKGKATPSASASEPMIRWPEAYWPGKDFVPPIFGGKITLFKMPKQPYYYKRDPLMGWEARTTAGVDLHVINLESKRHMLLFREPHVRLLARKLAACLERAQEKSLRPVPVLAAEEAMVVLTERTES